MPLQLSITQPTGVVATYHVIVNSVANYVHGGANNASVNINSYLDANAYASGKDPLGSLTQVDISPLVNNAVVAAPSLLAVIEQYLLTTALFSGATQVS